jgi:PII-like signaling protein
VIPAREAIELRFHFGERARDRDGPLWDAAMDVCARRGVWAAALLRGVEGFGAKPLVRTERLLSLSEDAPLVAVAVGDAQTIEGLAEELREIAAEGLVVIEEVEAVGGGAVREAGLGTIGTPTNTAAGVGMPMVGAPGDVVRATLWGPRSGASAPHVAAVDALHRHGAEAATVLIGVDGVLDGERRRARFVAGNRGVPAMTVAVGERGAITAALAEVEGLANVVTLQGVEHCSRIARGMLHSSARVTLVTSGAARFEAHPLYLEFVHELRRAGGAGATALRGAWGYCGDVAPHGDRVLALRRDVPLIVETVDSAERSAQWLEIAERLAGSSGVVYSEAIPRIFTLG